MNINKKKVLAISGSTKKKSTSGTILRNIARIFSTELEMLVYDRIDELPHFNPALDTTEPPEAVEAFRQLIAAADGVIICTPEYVFSLPGSLKNALEWTVSTTLFSAKPLAIIVAAASGEKAFASLDLIMTTIEALLPDTSKLLIRGAKGKIDANGVIADQKLLREIKRLIQSFSKSMDLKEKKPAKYLD